MAREKTYKGVLGEWEQLNAMLAVNSANLPALEPSRLRFADSWPRPETPPSDRRCTRPANRTGGAPLDAPPFLCLVVRQRQPFTIRNRPRSKKAAPLFLEEGRSYGTLVWRSLR
jgi:hypothetical protein